MPSKIPTKWRPREGWVLTWYPPFTFPTPQTPDRTVFVYDDTEPFVESGDGYECNGHFDLLGDTLVHPGAYALNIRGEEPGFDPDAPVHPDAVQVNGKG